MKTICANCGAIQGPFHSIHVLSDIVWVCMNTKKEPERIKACVERREKIDTKKYKEQLHPYA